MLHSSSVSQQQHVQQSVMHSASKSVSAADAAVTSLVSFVSMMPLLSCIAPSVADNAMPDCRSLLDPRPPWSKLSGHLVSPTCMAAPCTRPPADSVGETLRFRLPLHARHHRHHHCDQTAHARPTRAHRCSTEFHGCCRHGPRMLSFLLFRQAAGCRHTAACG